MRPKCFSVIHQAVALSFSGVRTSSHPSFHLPNEIWTICGPGYKLRSRWMAFIDGTGHRGLLWDVSTIMLGSRWSEHLVGGEDRGYSCCKEPNWREDVEFVERCSQTDIVRHSSLENALGVNFVRLSERQSGQFSKIFWCEIYLKCLACSTTKRKSRKSWSVESWFSNQVWALEGFWVIWSKMDG